MIDTATQKPIRVSSESPSGPYITLSVNVLDRVHKLLQENGISHWIDHQLISFDGRPAEAIINIHKKSDPHQVQALLDAVA